MRWWCIATPHKVRQLDANWAMSLLTHNDPSRLNVMDLKLACLIEKPVPKTSLSRKTVNSTSSKASAQPKGCYPVKRWVVGAHYRGIVKRRHAILGGF